MTRAGLGLQDIKDTIVPNIDDSDAKNIVLELEASLSWLDSLAKEYKKAEEFLTKLDQGLLAKAFRGELVPQDPNDEPADKLLKRIRAARAAQPKPRRGRRNLTS